MVVPHHDVAGHQARCEVLVDKHLEHVTIDIALHRDHLATSETDLAKQVRPLALAVGRVLTTTVGGGAALAHEARSRTRRAHR